MDRSGQQNKLVSHEARLKEMFDAARMITDTVGAVHEFQAIQMKNWPLITLDGAVYSEASVDIGDARQRESEGGNLFREHRPVSVTYSVKTDPSKRKPRNYKKKWEQGVLALKTWTRELFWPDTSVRVIIDGQEVLDGSTRTDNSAS